MKKEITFRKNILLITISTFSLFCLTLTAQVNIKHQGFDSNPEDNWNYVTTLNGGSFTLNSTASPFYVSAPNSYRIGGSASGTPSDPQITFDNVNTTGYSNVKIQIAFASDGSVDDNDDLYLDISYNNGTTYPTSIKLLDGKNKNGKYGTFDILTFNHPPNFGTTVGSIYSYSIPTGNSQVKIRIRLDESDSDYNVSDYCFIDNVRISGVPNGTHMNLSGMNMPILHNSLAAIVNGTDFGSTQIVSDEMVRTFTVKNIGVNTLNLTGTPIVAISGSTDFTVTQLPSNSLVSETQTTFKIKFAPSTIGLKTASVIIYSNDDDENPFVFEIKGLGIQNFFDSDNDGIFDNVDIDDDNDGIIDSLEESNCVTALGNVVNYKFLQETFGSGNRTTINTTYDATTTYCYEDGTVGVNTLECPQQSSTELNDGKYTIGKEVQTIATWAPAYWYTGKDHTGDLNGRMAIFNASYDPGIFYTASISGAIPNIPIQYSFWVINLDRSDAPGIATRLRPNVRVEFRDLSDNVLAVVNTGDIPPTSASNLSGDWINFSANLVLNVSSFKVIFINNNTGGTGNDLAIDDILITQTLCDKDNDGIADLFDLDSDNDGIPDVIEVGLGNISNGKAKIDTSWVDANQNGLHDAAESIVILPDFDGDNVPNVIDLDSDNDTVFDVDESGAKNINAALGYVNGDGDINGDGVGDGLETETFRNKDTNGDGTLEGFGDGILDIYDYNNNVYGNLNQGENLAPFLNYVLDTDSDGNPDYLDLNSNGVNFDISQTLYANLDTNNDGIIDGTSDLDKDGILDNFDTNTTYFGSPRDLERKLHIEFDGRNDYAQDANIINGWANASLMAWININNAFSNEGIIVGQDKFNIKINSASQLVVKANGTNLNYSVPLTKSQWIHVGAIYDSNNSLLKLFVNGKLVNSTSISGGLNSDTSLFTIAKNPITNTNYFYGKIDEVRVFNIALTDSQYQKIVYQEIIDNAGQIRGLIIPKDVPSLAWNNLIRYFKMDNYKNDIIDNHTTLSIDSGTGAKIYNCKVIKPQQAPMPFITEQSGNFCSAVNSTQKQIRGLDVEEYEWSIVHAKHNITSTNNTINLGLIVDPAVLIKIQNDSKLQNDWYLALNGKIDLEGKSQLLQTTDSDLAPTSIGTIERDQQGTTNKFNYNYWSSPVGPANTSSNNNNYNVTTVLKDGTNPSNPVNINWIGGYNSSAGTPINLPRYWIYKFQNVSNVYANWAQINETGLLAPSQGFTLKGSSAASANQNYTFVGKPFNGTITNPIAANNSNLSGNPYASAIDASKFITDNSSSITGTLYFWEHYTTNNTHLLAQYQGGYATRNLVGGVAPVSPPLISGLGSSTRIPGRFIPVGQGFFVMGNNTGGTIIFNNSQRIFIKEDHTNSNVMFKNTILSNQNDTYLETNPSIIRLGCKNVDYSHRQILIGFMDDLATSELDYGYDSPLYDEQQNDFFFNKGTSKLVIQGEGYFDSNAIYPITIKASTAGNIKFMIEEVANFDPNQAIYIHNATTNTYHDIRNEIYEVAVAPGTNETQFSLRFKIGTTLSNEDVSTNELEILYTQNNNVISIKNTIIDLNVSKVSLYNILGQIIKTWDVTNENQTEINIPVEQISSGTYIVKTETNKGNYSKKIIKN